MIRFLFILALLYVLFRLDWATSMWLSIGLTVAVFAIVATYGNGKK